MNPTIEQTDINVPFEMACQFVAHTAKSVFVTGKAGTGKTTFLKQLREHTPKKLAVAAPTGVAAIHAGGVTLHSLFQLPFKPFLPTVSNALFQQEQNFCDQKTLFTTTHLSAAKIDVIKELEVLIIDEVSMVRADLLDAIDTILRHYRGNESPFGGLQMVFIGDLYQLPPVVRNEEWSVMQLYYDSPFFFEAHALRALNPLVIELQKTYRQKDGLFLDILNRIRVNGVHPTDLDHLNTYYKPTFRPSPGEAYITLTTHNDKAETINKHQLNQLKTEERKYKAFVTGDFNERSYPVELQLQLKVNAQVMFIKNDKGDNRKFYNGMLAVVTELADEYIMVKPVSGADVMKVERETWKNIRYQANKEQDKIEEEELGSFVQFPLRLAWAITIHKSQGLTFDRAIVDAGDSFAAGQVYVALSRLTSTKELVLYSKISTHSIRVDERILKYLEVTHPVNELEGYLKVQQQKFLAQSLKKAFQFDDLVHESYEQYIYAGERQIPEQQMAVDCLKAVHTCLADLHKVGLKFIGELERILPAVEKQGYEHLHQRVSSASAYFDSRLTLECITPLWEHITFMIPKKKTKKYVKEVQLMLQQIKRQKATVEQAKHYAEGLLAGTDVKELLKKGKPKLDEEIVEIVKEKPKKGESHRISLDMFLAGKTIQQIADERNYAVTTIEGHLCSFLKTGEVIISQLVDRDTQEKITAIIDEIGPLSSKTIKERLDESITYGQIKAVLEIYNSPSR
ncbi:helix-turn-helix domain-containing protein [Cytophaga hutchinsonii]|uniref:Helicase-related protein n=1 Tax=Cytophaga hutchinsonii (strain ATCC 33406 / DSM 1761 / CIP 103989 / NBRC 15051 / NCIMB 9469 / D465) TaxID=269798 RepID=A0A6N4SW85_CYTH3|nr:helix-turn-helix domain-containing protein [Cytophaga hutchinsonii]ABG60886.1 helicase-related protein [Cytophaga hutchinsonii ATCC 33406]SFX99662.1 Helicase [Cytophaga hutchinsonii ATCC 33406]